MGLVPEIGSKTFDIFETKRGNLGVGNKISDGELKKNCSIYRLGKINRLQAYSRAAM